MFYKWATYYANNKPEEEAFSERCAPSILITFINMILFQPNDPLYDSCGEGYMYWGQVILLYPNRMQ